MKKTLSPTMFLVTLVIIIRALGQLSDRQQMEGSIKCDDANSGGNSGDGGGGGWGVGVMRW